MRADDWTFRPTVVVRCGNGQGSGTIIASLDGVTLVLTAAHVIVEGKRPIAVELHRYNLGLEKFTSKYSKVAGKWPRSLPADRRRRSVRRPGPPADRGDDADALTSPRLAPGVEEPKPGTVVTSVGIDLGEHLSSWLAYVGGVGWLNWTSRPRIAPS